MDLQALFGRHVEIANNLSVVNHVIAGGTISTDQFASIGPLADTIVGHLSGMISMQRPNDTYAMIPQHMFEIMNIKQKKAPSTPAVGTPAAKRTPGDSTEETPPAKVPKGDTSPGTPGKPKTPPADLGFLEYSTAKPANPPSLGFAVTNPRKKDSTEYPCPAFVFKGWACDRKKCNLVHVTFKKLSDADKEKFVGYVESHKANVQFVQGQGPSGTT
jgi:hypothetical protein